MIKAIVVVMLSYFHSYNCIYIKSLQINFIKLYLLITFNLRLSQLPLKITILKEIKKLDISKLNY